MSTPHDGYDLNWDYDPGQTIGSGATHQVSGSPPDEDERVNELRKVVEEVTRKKLPEAPAKAPIGFF